MRVFEAAVRVNPAFKEVISIQMAGWPRPRLDRRWDSSAQAEPEVEFEAYRLAGAGA